MRKTCPGHFRIGKQSTHALLGSSVVVVVIL